MRDANIVYNPEGGLWGLYSLPFCILIIEYIEKDQKIEEKKKKL